jgi:hypothetical protein
MPATFVKKGIKGRQGIVIGGPIPLFGYQVQFWAPISPAVTFNDRSLIGFTGIPDGRIVHLNVDGLVEPGLPTNVKFTMPLMVQSEGAGYSTLPTTAVYGTQTPYMSLLPGQSPNINLLPMCAGYEFLSTEYEPEESYIPGRTPLTATYSLTDPAIAGVIRPLTEPNEICIGFVSSPPGTPRMKFNPAGFVPGQGYPNPQRSVTGKNEPGLSFWGHPLPAGIMVEPESPPSSNGSGSDLGSGD